MPADPNSDDATAGTSESTPDDVPRRVNGGDPDEYVDTEKWVEAHQSHYEHTGDGRFVAAVVSAVADAKAVDPLDYREVSPCPTRSTSKRSKRRSSDAHGERRRGSE